MVDIIVVLLPCKNEDDPIKNKGARVLTRLYIDFSDAKGSYPLPWKPEFESDLAQNMMQLFPNPNADSDKIWLRSAFWLQRYSCLKVWADVRTDGRTDAISTPIL